MAVILCRVVAVVVVVGGVGIVVVVVVVVEVSRSNEDFLVAVRRCNRP